MHLQTTVRVGPDANQAGSMRAPGAAKLPNVWWRAIAAIFYLVPAWDVYLYGQGLWNTFKGSIWLMLPFGKYRPVAKILLELRCPTNVHAGH